MPRLQRREDLSSAMGFGRRLLFISCAVSLAILSGSPRGAATAFGSEESAQPLRPERALSRGAGKALYLRYCVVCHGERGDGKGSAEPLIDSVKPPDFLDPEYMSEQTPEGFFQAITLGVSGTTMPGWVDILEPQGRWDLVAYVWSLRPAVSTAPSPESCIACHSARGPGRDLTAPGALAGRSDGELTQRAAAAEAHQGNGRVEQVALVQVARLLELAADGATLASFERIQIPRMLDLLVDEYSNGVENGVVVNELEYYEAQSYLRHIEADIERVVGTGGLDSTTARDLLRELADVVAQKGPDAKVAELAKRLKSSVALNLRK